jgi:glycerophosphoryl diester phosphodiesterase
VAKGGGVKRLFPGNNPLIAAHRGLALEAPENTLAAFRDALAVGADLIETDVHGSSDAVAMIAHYPGLLRVAGRSGMVVNMTRQQLQRVDLGGESMPTLEEALDAFPRTPFSIDIKDAAAVEPTIAAIERTGARERVMIASFSEARRRAVVRRLGSVATLGTHRHAIAAYSPLSPFHGLLRGIDALFLPTRAYGFSMFSPRMVRNADRHGVTLGAWTINDPDEMESLWRRGVRVIVTDRTDLAVSRRTELSDEPTSPSRG